MLALMTWTYLNIKDNCRKTTYRNIFEKRLIYCKYDAYSAKIGGNYLTEKV